MKELSITTLEADYFKDFSCVGSHCRHNCCNEKWNIYIDKKTYQKYQNIRGNKELSALIRKQVKRTANPQNDQGYAYIEQLKNPVRCGLQTEDGLCLVQQKLGADYLSDVCKTYPRCLNAYLQKGAAFPNFERACQISCEEVVRILLNKKGHILFDAKTERKTYSAYVHVPYRSQYSLVETNRPILSYYYDIKSFGIGILQNDEYALEDRLILLSVFLQKLSLLEESKVYEKIPQLLLEVMATIDKHNYDEVLLSVQGTEFASDIGYFLIKQSFSTNDESLSSPIIQQINKHLEMEGSWQEYAGNYEEFMQDKWIFAEHLIVNVFFQEMMPFYKELSIVDNGLYLTAIYITLKFLITASLGPRTEMSDIELIDLVSFFGRLIIHSSDKITNLVSFMKTNDMTTPAHLAVLIKG